jgi:hypothetical protein
MSGIETAAAIAAIASAGYGTYATIEAKNNGPQEPTLPPPKRDQDEEIRRAIRNASPSRGRNFLTVNPTNGLSVYDLQNPQAGSSGLNLPPNQ